MAWGVLLHLVVGAVLGVVFSAVVPSDHTLASAMVLGAGCNLVVMSFAVALLVPRVSPTLSAALPLHGGAWVVAHALFGAVLGIAPSLRRWLHAARGRPAHLSLRPRTSS